MGSVYGNVPADTRTAVGRGAERLVADYLIAQGFQVLGRNLRLGPLELDVVARLGPLVVVVEVRTRGNGAWTSALGSLDELKRARIRRAGERLWRQRFARDPSVQRLRFDAAVVLRTSGNVQVEYVPAAF
jgi:putative endonuclease